jgi:ankyrin repeat protein
MAEHQRREQRRKIRTHRDVVALALAERRNELLAGAKGTDAVDARQPSPTAGVNMTVNRALAVLVVSSEPSVTSRPIPASDANSSLELRPSVLHSLHAHARLPIAPADATPDSPFDDLETMLAVSAAIYEPQTVARMQERSQQPSPPTFAGLSSAPRRPSTDSAVAGALSVSGVSRASAVGALPSSPPRGELITDAWELDGTNATGMQCRSLALLCRLERDGDRDGTEMIHAVQACPPSAQPAALPSAASGGGGSGSVFAHLQSPAATAVAMVRTHTSNDRRSAAVIAVLRGLRGEKLTTSVQPAAEALGAALTGDAFVLSRWFLNTPAATGTRSGPAAKQQGGSDSLAIAGNVQATLLGRVLRAFVYRDLVHSFGSLVLKYQATVPALRLASFWATVMAWAAAADSLRVATLCSIALSACHKPAAPTINQASVVVSAAAAIGAEYDAPKVLSWLSRTHLHAELDSLHDAAMRARAVDHPLLTAAASGSLRALTALCFDERKGRVVHHRMLAVPDVTTAKPSGEKKKNGVDAAPKPPAAWMDDDEAFFADTLATAELEQVMAQATRAATPPTPPMDLAAVGSDVMESGREFLHDDDAGCSAIHVAAIMDQGCVLRWLLTTTCGPDKTRQRNLLARLGSECRDGSGGRTVLHLAASAGSCAFLETFLQAVLAAELSSARRFAMATLPDACGMSPVMYAAQNNQAEALAMLLDAFGPTALLAVDPITGATPLFTAAVSGHRSLLDALAARPLLLRDSGFTAPSLFTPTVDGLSVAAAAAMHQHASCVEWCMRQLAQWGAGDESATGAKAKAKAEILFTPVTVGRAETTLLHVAAGAGAVAVLELFSSELGQSLGVAPQDLMREDRQFETVVQWAMRGGHSDVVRWLRGSGAPRDLVLSAMQRPVTSRPSG